MSHLEDTIHTLLAARNVLERAEGPAAQVRQNCADSNLYVEAIRQIVAETSGYIAQAGGSFYATQANALAGISDGATQVSEQLGRVIDEVERQVTQQVSMTLVAIDNEIQRLQANL